MGLLELRGLTMRFGGLTAVNQVSLSVEQGQVFSVIGPNGAGKTTVFNAVTGVYEPTEGEILFDGRSLRRPFRPRIAVAALLVGLLTGLFLAVFSADVDGAWRAAIVLNTGEPGDPFPLRKAFADFSTYLGAGVLPELEQNRLADLELREKSGKQEIWSRRTKKVLESHDDASFAEKRLDTLKRLMDLSGSPRTVVPADGRWLVALGPHVLGTYDTEEAAKRQVSDLADIPTAEIEEKDGKSRLVKNGRVLAEFAQRFEAEDHKAAMAWAKDAQVVDGRGKALILDDGRRNVLEVAASRAEAQTRLLRIAIDAGKLRWRLTTRVSAQALDFSDDPVDAVRKAAMLEKNLQLSETPETAALQAKRGRARAILWLCFFGGFAAGAAGTWAVWNRARRTTDHIARCGLGRTFQNIRLFPQMLAVENVVVAMDAKRPAALWAQAFRTKALRAREAAARERAMELLRFVGIERRANDLARNLPYGDQRRLEIARALATEPRLLLLDEPAAGMNPSETGELTGLIRKIRDGGTTVLLIEHHMKVVMGISDRIAVLHYGSKIAEGTPEEIRANPAVIEAYLGKEEVS